MIGQTVSHYRVLDTLGAGGMGVVYLAEDLRLKRKVALKFLSPERTTNPEAIRRFELEAQSASALDHPNIGTIFEIDQAPDGRLFIAMACYAGESLRDVMARGPLSSRDAVNYATQILSGLAKAHQAGIVHRDIKPANLLITPDGVVKIVDFGVAKLMNQQGATQTRLTDVGSAVGTPAYMSPEQTLGSEADARSDVWAVGVVLYEMLAGRLPVAPGHSSPAASVVANGEPPSLIAARPQLPAHLERVVRIALAARADARYQSAGEFRAALEASEITESPVNDTFSRKARYVAAGVALGALAVIGYAGWTWQSTPDVDVSLSAPTQLAASVGVELLPSVSADGRILAYQSDQAGNNDVWVLQIGGAAINRTADSPVGDEAPRLSPDGTQIAFWSARDGGGIYVMPTLSGSARKVAAARSDIASDVAWSPDGARLAVPIAPSIAQGKPRIELLSLQTGSVHSIALRVDSVRPALNICLDLAWSPDGQFIACVQANSYNNQTATLWVVRLADETFIRLSDPSQIAWTPTWSADSRAVFFTSNRSGGTMDLFLQRLNAAGEADGPARQLTTGLDVQHAAVTRDGTQVMYARGRRVANVWRGPVLSQRRATWADMQQVTLDQAYIEAFDLSPDGKTLAVESDRGGYTDIWTLPAGGGEMQRLTHDPAPDWWPSWSPDGTRIAFYSNRAGGIREAWVQPLGGGEAWQVTRGGGLFPRWSPDGSEIYVGDGSILAMPAEGGPTVTAPDRRAARQILKADRTQGFATMEFSMEPKGHTFVIAAGQQPARRLWRYSVDGSTRTALTRGQASAPSWSPDGRWIYFHTFREGPATYQLERPGLNIWRVSADGRREEPVTLLTGRRGLLGANIANDGEHVYFTWREDVSDIWMMKIERTTMGR